MPERSTPTDTPRVYRTRALGTIAEVVVTEGGALVAASELLQLELERIDRLASRFRDDSELSRLNGGAGTETRVSAELLEALQVALAMAEATGGLVDPTVGLAMDRLGYDRDFSEVLPGVDGRLPEPQAAPGWRSVTVDPERSAVGIPAGASIDLGATAKALAADRAASTIHHRLGCGVLVSLGGDAAVAGPAPDGGFAVGIADTCTSRHASRPWASSRVGSPPRAPACASGASGRTRSTTLWTPPPACRARRTGARCRRRPPPACRRTRPRPRR